MVVEYVGSRGGLVFSAVVHELTRGVLRRRARANALLVRYNTSREKVGQMNEAKIAYDI